MSFGPEIKRINSKLQLMRAPSKSRKGDMRQRIDQSPMNPSTRESVFWRSVSWAVDRRCLVLARPALALLGCPPEALLMVKLHTAPPPPTAVHVLNISLAFPGRERCHYVGSELVEDCSERVVRKPSQDIPRCRTQRPPHRRWRHGKRKVRNSGIEATLHKRQHSAERFKQMRPRPTPPTSCRSSSHCGFRGSGICEGWHWREQP